MASRTYHVVLALFGALVVWKHAYGLTPDHQICASYAELYFANVVGRIPGGVDIIRPGDTTPCSKRPLKVKFRELDGRCNHPLNYGSAMKPVKRYIKADYHDADGHNTPRMFSVSGDNILLPSPRGVSRFIHNDKNRLDTLTMWVMQFGQFIDHDITSAPVPTEHNSSINCCNIPPQQIPEECFTVMIPKNDPVFPTCMEFVRSEPARDAEGHIIYPREQLNALTSFIDGSGIYGSNAETSARLRTGNGKGALLKTKLVNGKERLPQDFNANSNMCLVSNSKESFCQLSGDERVNEQPGLGSAHLVFHLFHNVIVRALTKGILAKHSQKTVRPSDVEDFLLQEPNPVHEQIFQEARKIVGAVLQKITYCDWLPLILGPDLMRKFSLDCKGRSSYNKFVDPRIANAFLSAAFRFGHSLIPNKVSINYVKLDLKDQFMIPDSVLQYYESIMEGMQEPHSQQRFDRHVVEAVTRHLFESTKGRTGALDLVSLNIQRGRDHGVPAYHVWRNYYGLRQIHRERDLRRGVQMMRKMYRDYRDVDLFVGGLLEKNVRGGIVGDTFGHIIANQFADLKFGDAYFFNGKDRIRGFTNEQLRVIRHYTLRDVACTTGSVKKSQRNIFRSPTGRNPQTLCDSSSDFDITPWLAYN